MGRCSWCSRCCSSRSTALVALLHLPLDLLVVLAVLGLVAVFGFGYVLTRRSYVVRLDDEGYRVRLVRGAGVTAARWKDVEEAAAATPRGIAVRGAAAPGRPDDHDPGRGRWPRTARSSSATCRTTCSAARACARSEPGAAPGTRRT